jgi:hypothetical protein
MHATEVLQDHALLALTDLAQAMLSLNEFVYVE